MCRENPVEKRGSSFGERKTIAEDARVWYALNVTRCDIWRSNMSEKKANTKERILQESCALLIEKGLYETSMEEIAEVSGCTRRTLYRYFPSKDELIFEVVILILMEWNDVQQEIFNSLSGLGMDRVEVFLMSLVAYMEEKLDTMRFLGAFDFYFQDRSKLQCSEDVKVRLNAVSHSSYQYLLQLVELGIEDGSLFYAGELDVLVSTISQVLWSFGQRIALRGGQIEQEDHVSGMKLMVCQIDLYLKALRKPQGGVR
jgi:AcrR family transcriptional regulator